MRSVRSRCACLSTFCFAHACTLFPVLIFIFHFYFDHQDIVKCSKVRQCMYFPFSKLASSSSIYFLLTDCSLSLSTPASVNWLAHTLDLPHFWQYSQFLIFVFFFWPLFVKATTNNRHHRHILPRYHWNHWQSPLFTKISTFFFCFFSRFDSMGKDKNQNKIFASNWTV